MDLHVFVFDFQLPFSIDMLVTLDSCIPFRFFCSFIMDMMYNTALGGCLW
jgi:hypothetical protein